MQDFFISYNKVDRSWAEWVAWHLEEMGYTTILQAWDFRPGSNFVIEMQRASAAATRTIAILSPDYLARLFTQSEWAAAFAQDPIGAHGKLLPIRVRDCKLEGLLSQIVYIDLVGLDEPAARNALHFGVSNERAKPAIRPTFPKGGGAILTDSPNFPNKPGGISVLVIYSKDDKRLYMELEKHLSIFRHNGIIKEWYSHNINEHEARKEEINIHIYSAQIILVLVSASFLASDYCYGVEISTAIQQHEKGEAHVIPVILRASHWQNSPIGRFQALPRDAQPVTTWPNTDEAFLSIATGIQLACEDLQNRLSVVLPHLAHVSVQLFDVFKPSGVPTITFVEPDNFYRLKWALAQPGRGVIIEGPSGIGKTTALRKAIEQLRISITPENAITILSARNPGDVQKLIDLSKWHNGAVAIDDFHRLGEPLREKIVDYLKYLADNELRDKKLVIVGIPGTGKKLVDIAFDVATRIEHFRLGKVRDEVILSMIEKGEKALNILFDRKSEIVRAVGGSLNIAQLLCADLVAREGIEKTQNETKLIPCDLEATIVRVMEILSLKFGDIVRFFALLGGPNDRTCIELLIELARVEDGFLSLSHIRDLRSDLSAGIDLFIGKNYMTSLKEKCPGYDNHLLYDDKALALVIDDPQLTFYLNRTPASHLTMVSGKRKQSVRNQIFISYSHADLKWLNRLRIHLKPLERENIINVWDDTAIKAGDNWRKEINKAIESAKVAILLVSADFLASDFVAENELPPLLETANAEGMTIVPLIVSPGFFMESEICQYQAINDPSKPLTMMNRNDQEKILVKVAHAVEAALLS